MALKPTPTTSQATPRMQATSILEKLRKAKNDLLIAEDAKDHQRSHLKKLESEIAKYQDERHRPKGISPNQALLKCNQKRKELRVERAIDYQEDIDRLKENITKWSKEYQEAEEYEKKTRAHVSKSQLHLH